MHRQGQNRRPIGLGAVMGVKKLKAVVLDGVQRIVAHDPAEMKRLSRHCNKWVNFPIPLNLLPGIGMALMGTFLRVTPALFPKTVSYTRPF